MLSRHREVLLDILNQFRVMTFTPRQLGSHLSSQATVCNICLVVLHAPKVLQICTMTLAMESKEIPRLLYDHAWITSASGLYWSPGYPSASPTIIQQRHHLYQARRKSPTLYGSIEKQEQWDYNKSYLLTLYFPANIPCQSSGGGVDYIFGGRWHARARTQTHSMQIC